MHKVVSTIFLACALTSCNVESYEEKQAKQSAARESVKSDMQTKLNEATSKFRQRYNAEPLADKLEGRTLSTYQVQKALMPSDGRPVMAAGTLIDIAKTGKELVLFFHVHGLKESLVFSKHYVLMELTCPMSLEEIEDLNLKEYSPWSDPDYLVAAKINEVEQAHQFLKTTSTGQDSSTSRELQVEYVGKGRCVGLEPLKVIFSQFSEKMREMQKNRKVTKSSKPAAIHDSRTTNASSTPRTAAGVAPASRGLPG